MGTRLSERELQNALDFCSRFCAPKEEMMYGQEDDATERPAQANARGVVQPEFLVNNLEVEEIEGYVIRLHTGSLGLSRVVEERI